MVSCRLWSRPKVKVGGVYRSGSVMIEIDDIDLLPFSSITDDDLARTGEADLETLVGALHTPARSTMTPSCTAWSSMSFGSWTTRARDPDRRLGGVRDLSPCGTTR